MPESNKDHSQSTETPSETATDPATATETTTAAETADPAGPASTQPGRDENPAGKNHQNPSPSKRPQPKGIAALFEKEELKDLFRSYLIVICVIEGFIFFVSFLSQMGPETVPFPWKSYFFAAFIIPLTITFLLGIIIISFDRYIFGHQVLSSEFNDIFRTGAENRSRIHKFHAFLYVIRQVPFLLGLICLVALSGIAYKLDDILAVIGDVGGRTAHYLFIGLAVVFAVAVVIGLIWMFLSYNIRKKTLEFQYQYKKDVVDKTGLVILDDERMMDRNGRILSFGQARQLIHKPADDDEKDLVIDQS
ncbi:MAG: hypothetical protein JXR80_08700 [Deltaproteobacteria bacterium]|nr:hypothetical protein [Deltaproteobacteria bacterium]